MMCLWVVDLARGLPAMKQKSQTLSKKTTSRQIEAIPKPVG
jgi:hypothetical protein